MPNERLTKQQELFYECYSDLEAYCFADLSVFSTESAFDDLAAALPSCTATNKRQFIAWAKKQLRRSLETQVSVVDPEMDFNAVLSVAEKHKRTRSDTKPMKYVFNGDAVLIDLTDRSGKLYVWAIPAEWLSAAQALWPCHVKVDRNGPYVAKKSNRTLRDGTTAPITIRVHRLFVSGPDWVQVLARDGNYLNFTNGNIYANATPKKPEKFVYLDDENVPEPVPSVTIEGEVMDEPLPAKPTKAPVYDECDEVAWVQQCHAQK